mmetsp:Transcript_75591/g.218372  ORF Transcript_75591/g.218372 Transcript_75591/m.218372 type:complete len:230 (+) Transcript_75591:1014-1703(+)
MCSRRSSGRGHLGEQSVDMRVGVLHHHRVLDRLVVECHLGVPLVEVDWRCQKRIVSLRHGHRTPAGLSRQRHQRCIVVRSLVAGPRSVPRRVEGQEAPAIDRDDHAILRLLFVGSGLASATASADAGVGQEGRGIGRSWGPLAFIARVLGVVAGQRGHAFLRADAVDDERCCPSSDHPLVRRIGRVLGRPCARFGLERRCVHLTIVHGHAQLVQCVHAPRGWCFRRILE